MNTGHEYPARGEEHVRAHVFFWTHGPHTLWLTIADDDGCALVGLLEPYQVEKIRPARLSGPKVLYAIESCTFFYLLHRSTYVRHTSLSISFRSTS